MEIFASRLSDAIEQYPQFLKEIERLQQTDPSKKLKYLDWQLKQLKRNEPLNEIISLTESFHKRQSQLEEKDLNKYKTLGDLREAIEALGKSRKERLGEAQEDLFSQERARATKNGIVVYDSDDVLAIKPRSVEESCYFGNNTKWCISATESQNYYNDYSINGQHFYFIINKNLPIKHPFQKVSWQGEPNKKPSFWRSDDINEKGESKPFQRNSPDFKKWEALTPNLEVILDRIAEHLRKNPKNPVALQMEKGDFSSLAGIKDDEKEDLARSLTTVPVLLNKLATDRSDTIRYTVAHNMKAPSAALERLARDRSDSVREAVASNPSTPPAILELLADDEDPDTQGAVATNPSTPPAALDRLADSEYSGIAFAVARNHRVPPATLEKLASDYRWTVRLIVAGNPSTPPAALENLASDKEDGVRLSVAKNPSTPPAVLETLLGDKNNDVRNAAQENLDRRSLSARADVLVEATMQLRLSAHARLALEEAAASVAAASDASLWEILEDGTPEEIEKALEPYEKVKIDFLDRTLDDTYLVEDKIVEWDGGRFSSVKSKDKWLYENTDELRDDIEEKLAEQFAKDFWHSPSTLYHATDESNIESIMTEGLRAESRTRGLTNRGVGAAIFTTLEPDVAAYGTYGDTVLEIDTRAMKRDGLRFRAEQEPAVFRGEAMSAIASVIGLDDFYNEEGRSDGTDDPFTVILFINKIPPKYLKVLD